MDHIHARHFLHVGVHKTGSTWLQQCVFPAARSVTYSDGLVAACVANLIHAEDDEFRAGAFRALVTDFEQRGVRLVVSHEALSGAVWAGALSGDRLARRLADVMPNADVVIVVRNQPEMLIALYAQYVNEGGIGSFGRFLAGDHPGPPLDRAALEYDSIVSAYRAAFGGRVWVVPYEHLRKDPVSFTSELDRRYGLGLAEIPLRRVNVSLSPAGLLALRAWNRLFRESAFSPDPLVAGLPGGRRVRNILQETIDPQLRRFVPKGIMEGALEIARSHALAFEASNVRLAAFCDFPLREYGYPWPARAE